MHIERPVFIYIICIKKFIKIALILFVELNFNIVFETRYENILNKKKESNHIHR